MASKTVLITGCSGFIGNYLTNELLKRDYKITGIDLKAPVLEFNQNNFIFYDSGINNFCKENKKNFEIILHLAQSPHYRDFPSKSKEIFEANNLSSFNLLEYGRVTGCRQMILFSTGSVYGGTDNEKKIDENSKINIKGFYASTKYCSEIMAVNYSDFYKIKILRPFFVYGPGQKNMMIPNLINKIINKEEIFLSGDNSGMKFTPTYVSDCINLVINLIKKEDNKNYQIFNLSGNETISIRKICEIAGKHLNIEPVFKNKTGLINNFICNSEKIYKFTQYEPEISIKKRIKSIVEK